MKTYLVVSTVMLADTLIQTSFADVGDNTVTNVDAVFRNKNDALWCLRQEAANINKRKDISDVVFVDDVSLTYTQGIVRVLTEIRVV